MARTIAGALVLLAGLAAVSLALGAAPDYVGPIYSGSELDYQPSIIRRLPGNQLMVVFERLSTTFSGDLYVTSSSDGGLTWSVPQPILPSALNQRHPALVQLGADSFTLFYLVDETGSSGYRLHRATSTDGLSWTDQGALDLGWALPGEVNPSVIREADGSLTMTYHRLSGPSYIARSLDGGATWDTLRTQVSVGSAALPRLARRDGDGLYLVTYQVNPGGNDLDIYAKTSSDPYDWSGPQWPLSTAVNSHDSQPIVLEDGTFLVAYASTPVYYFDLFYRTSRDGMTWSEAVQVENDPARYDTQPHPLLKGTPGHILLTWSHQNGSEPYVDHDVWINTDLVIPAGLGASSKVVDPPFFHPAAVLTYTLVLSNAGPGPTLAELLDPIPPATAYEAGSLWASAGEAGYDPVTGAITWTGVLSVGVPVVVRFQASTALDLWDGDVVTNTAWLTDGQGVVYPLLAAATCDTIPPSMAIVAPVEGEIISSTGYLVTGIATDTVSGIARVDVAVDGGPWHTATGGESWTFAWTGFTDGEHRLTALATDRSGLAPEPCPGIRVLVDTTPPALLAASPAAGATGVPLSATLVLTFSEPIAIETLAYTVAPDPGGWWPLWNAQRTTVYLSHDDFAPGRPITVSLVQARDEARNPLAPVEWSFTTIPAAPSYRVYLPLVSANSHFPKSHSISSGTMIAENAVQLPLWPWRLVP